MPFVRGVISIASLTAASLSLAPLVIAQASGQFVEMNCVPVGAPEPAPFGPNQYGAGVEVINGSAREVKSFNALQSQTAHLEHAKAEAGSSGVEVINGETHRTVFWNGQAGETASAESTVRGKTLKHGSGKNGPSGPLAQIEIMNGAQHETLIFDALPNPFDGSDAILRTAKPVVLGVTSSGSKNWNGAIAPVVVAIAPSDSQPETGSQPQQEDAQPPDGIVPPNSEASPESRNSNGGKQPVVLAVASAGSTNAEGETRTVAVDVAPRAPKRPPYRRPTPEP